MALNDPQWGNKGKDGPPDLDEIIRKFRQQLFGMFGGKGGNQPPRNAPPSMRQWGGGLGLVAILALLVWVASGFYIVDEGRRGIVLRFGKYTETTLPGPRWHVPYPIESAEVINISQVRTVEVGYRGSVRNKELQESLMLTDDENIVDLQFAVQFILNNPEDYLFNHKNPDDSVRQIAESAIREIVGKSRMDFVLYEGRSEVAVRAQQLMQQILDRYQTGIAVSKVTMQNAQPPEQVQAAFDDAVKAGQDRERQKNEGQAYANDVIPKARGTASRLLQEAEGYRQAMIARADGDASRFRQLRAEYEKAPGVTRDRLYLETMQQVLGSVTKIVTDTKGGGNLLYLPIDKLMNPSAGAAVTEVTRAPSAPETQSAGEATARGRDSLRREREAR